MLYINVGGQGIHVGSNTTGPGGYNGGGSITVTWGDGNERRSTGGGATSISKSFGTLKHIYDTHTTDSIMIVAGGGGGAGVNEVILGWAWSVAGSGGGSIGGSGIGTEGVQATGGSQTAGGISATMHGNTVDGSFGLGATASSGLYSGGGGGYYGGGATFRGAGGGSGYLNPSLTQKSMTMFCEENCEQYTAPGDTTTVTTALETPTENTPKKGNGYAKITLLSID